MMSTNDRPSRSGNNVKKRDLDSFGLNDDSPTVFGGRGLVRRNSGGFVDLGNESQYGAGGHQASGANEIFAEEQGDVPWWRSNFFISQPVLFGTWDGVFTSCLINIFGVIVFLRAGWMVAQAGVVNAVLIVLFTVFVALVSVLSAVGICERCRIESGGVYFLLSHTLGSRLGGALGLLYCFGQAVGCALNILGFGESMAGVVNLQDNVWAARGFACAAVVLLCSINIAGVKWVVKLQFALLFVMLFAALDFFVGSFTHVDIESGFEGWLSGNMRNNTWSDYKEGYTWFTVFGVFFPTITGILSGINMSGDLRSPSTNIPNGSLAAVVTGTFLYLIFVITLAATCKREALLLDSFLTAKVSAVSFLLLAGLYVSSMSACLGAMYGTPRVLQSVANENVVPGLGFLGRGKGPNRVPVYSMAVVAVVTITFILIGDINKLAPIVTMPYLITYACIDYSYFALAQTFDLQHRRELRFQSKAHRSPSQSESPQSPNYGTNQNDLDILFPERIRHKNLAGSPTESFPSQNGSVSNVDTEPIVQNERNSTVHSKTKNWYSSFCNRWLSLSGVLTKIIIMFLVHWIYALGCLTVIWVIWFYIGMANPAVKPGRTAEFKFFNWFKNSCLHLMGKRVNEYEQFVVTPVHPGVDVRSAQLNEDNEDFASRRRYHQSATVHGHYVNMDD